MLKRAASAGCSSTFTFATTAWPCRSRAISSSAGASILHGPHHSAQKSTRTGRLDWSTSRSKLVSVGSMVGFIVVLQCGFSFWFKVVQFRQQSVEVERPCGHAQCAVHARPFLLRTVAVEFDAVAVRVAQVDGFADAMVGRAF